MRFYPALVFCLLWCGVTHAQAMLPARVAEDCTVYLNNRGPSADGLMDWRELVEVEHCDRITRLKRLTEQEYGAEVQFFDGRVAADRLPPDVRVRIPILRVVFPERVFFDTDESVLRPEAWEVTRIIADNLRREPADVAVFVVGHADIRGDRQYNENLSIDRSNALSEAILGHGVNVASVWRLGFGEDMPLVAGTSDYAHSQNRRIEFLFAARPEAIPVAIEDILTGDLCQGRNAEEVSLCKTQVAPRNDYSAVETLTARRQVRASSRGVKTSPGAQDVSVVMSEEDVEVGIEVERIVVNPRAPRKLTVNPRNGIG